MQKTTEPPLPAPVSFTHNDKTYAIPGDCLAGKHMRLLRELIDIKRAEEYERDVTRAAYITDTKVAGLLMSQAKERRDANISSNDCYAALLDPDIMRGFLPQILDIPEKEALDIVENFPQFMLLKEMIVIASGWETHLKNLNSLLDRRDQAMKKAMQGNTANTSTEA